MPLTIGSNISSLRIQRALSASQAGLSTATERLASGQRINKSSDDAAGLSVADSLSVSRRVYTQGTRNLNDGISALQIADSTVEQLSTIVTRIRELAEQAANGSFSSSQREAIDEEAQALRDEYFRVSRAASFNHSRLFDGTLSQGLRLQGGFGLDGSIQSTLGGVMGNGSFGAPANSPIGGDPGGVALGDVNGDGNLDIVGTNVSDGNVSVSLGAGNGSFSAAASFSVSFNPYSVALGDLNGDGALDIVTANNGGDNVSVLLGNGRGSFSAASHYTAGDEPNSVTLGDLNGDGTLDIVTVEQFGTSSVLLGQGNGTFAPAISNALLASSLMSATLSDFSGDGILDLAAADYGSGTVNVLIGAGDGRFGPATAYNTGAGPVSIDVGDVNGDGALDIVVASYQDDNAGVLLGQGNGSFLSPVNYATGPSPMAVKLGDLNGDGVLDMATVNQAGVSVLLGNGNGTFGAATNSSLASDVHFVDMGDVNGDGILDIVSANQSTTSRTVLLGGQREGVAPLLPFSLQTQADALQSLAPLDRKLSQLAAQRGIIGAFQSRLSTALSTLQSSSEAYAAAESRIRDADVAVEAANLARLRISQEAAASVLAQANQQPQLAIVLLR